MEITGETTDNFNQDHPFAFLDSADTETLDSDCNAEFNDDWDGISESDDPLSDNFISNHDDEPATGAVAAYLASVKDKLAHELSATVLSKWHILDQAQGRIFLHELS